MCSVTVACERWEHGWELTVEGEDAVSTQCTTLAEAPQQIRDYLDTVWPDVDHSDWEVLLRSPAGAEVGETFRRTPEELMAFADGALGAAGLEVTDPVVRALNMCVARGEISGDEAVARIREHYRD